MEYNRQVSTELKRWKNLLHLGCPGTFRRVRADNEADILFGFGWSHGTDGAADWGTFAIVN